MSLTGRCLCGAVRYTATGSPAFAGNCHCGDCKKSSGSGSAPTMFFPRANVAITGEVKYFASQGGSGATVERGFCPNCGSQLFGRPGTLPDMIGIRAGSLDDPSKYAPQLDIFTRRACQWEPMDEALPKFPDAPPPRQ